MADPTWEEVKAAAYDQICQPGSPATEGYVDPDTWPAGDHGHTDCWIIGGLLAEVDRLTELVRSTRADLDGLKVVAAARRDEVERLTAELAKPVLIERPGTVHMAKIRLHGREVIVAATDRTAVTVDGVLVIDSRSGIAPAEGVEPNG